MTNPIQTAHDRATAAIKALADAGHRASNEHAHALDLLRAQVESLRTINAGLRERLADLEHRVTHTAEVLSRPDVEVLAMPVDTEAPREVVREVVRGHGWMHEVGAKPSDDSYDKRSAVIHKTGWVAYAPSAWKPRRGGLTEAQAIRWVLDGVLP